MKIVITGAGQIGTQLTRDALAAGHEVTVIRRRPGDVPGVRTVVGDAGDSSLINTALRGAHAVFHCIHAAYDSRAWARELPARERVVLDAAAAVGVPAVFPESVYAFGARARDLYEGVEPAPCSPLGQVRADLLQQRTEHPAVSISLVAADLFGPTGGSGSVANATILRPLVRGRRAVVLADMDAPHSWTYLPDLTRAMLHVAENVQRWAPEGHRVLHAPTAEPLTVRELADTAAALLGRGPVRVTPIPEQLPHVLRHVHPMLRALDEQSYLWRKPAVLRSGALMDAGLYPTPSREAIGVTVAALKA